MTVIGKESLRNVLNTSRRRVNKNSLTWWYVLKTSWRYLCKTSWRCLEDVLKTPWRGLEGVLKTSWRHLEDALKRFWRRFEHDLKTSSKGLEDVLKTYGQDEYIGLDLDLVLKTSSKDVRLRRKYSSWSRRLKTSWRRLLKTKTKDVFIKTNVCWVTW